MQRGIARLGQCMHDILAVGLVTSVAGKESIWVRAPPQSIVLALTRCKSDISAANFGIAGYAFDLFFGRLRGQHIQRALETPLDNLDFLWAQFDVFLKTRSQSL